MNKKLFIEYVKIIGISLLLFLFAVFTGVFQYAFSNKDEPLKQVSATGKTNYTIIIDAGHGGEDGGAVGLHGSFEKNINLSIAKQLNSLFSLTDIDTVMTRQTDALLYETGQENRKKFNDLNNRLKIAKSAKNPIFISIHQNKFPTEKYCGFQVYYSKNNEDSRVIADLLQQTVVDNLQPNNNRKTKKAGKNIFLLHRLDCPAILVECGFLSNSKEELLLNNEEYQKKLAFCMFLTLMNYADGDCRERM